MNILITGASGFIGSRIAKYFSKRNKVTCNFYNRPIKLKKVNKVKIDITKKINLKENIDTIIHCASKTPVNCYENKIIFNQNVKMMKNLISLAKNKNVKNFIFISSVSAFGKINKKFLLETDKPIQPNSYGRSKIKCENLLYEYSKKRDNLKFLSIRLPGTVGYGSHGNFISEITKKILKNKKIKASNQFSNFNNIIYVDDLSSFLDNFIKRCWSRYKFINIASKNFMQIGEVINLIYKKLKKKKNIEWVESKKSPFCIKMKRAIKCGFKPKSVKVSINSYTNDQLKNL